jgi:hypothetical protein
VVLMFGATDVDGLLPSHDCLQDEKNLYCGREVYLNTTSYLEQRGAYYKFKIPFTAFECNKGSAERLANINRVDFSNPNTRDADYCLDNLLIVSGGAAPFSNTRYDGPRQPGQAMLERPKTQDGPAPAPTPPPAAPTSPSTTTSRWV